MSWQRNEALLFTPIQIKILSAVLFGVPGKDGECRDFPNTSLAWLLFSGEPITRDVRVARVTKTLENSGMIERLRTAFGQDIALLAFRGDRKFIEMLKLRYPRWTEVEKAIDSFRQGNGLVPYQEIRVPEEVVKPKKEIVVSRIVPAKQAQPPLIVNPRATAPRAPSEYVPSITPPPYGSPKKECKTQPHVWIEKVSVPGYVVMECDICGAKGEIDMPDAQQKWAQMQAAMPKKSKAA